MRKVLPLLFGIAVLAGCADAQGGNATIGPDQPATPVSAPFTQVFAERARSWLATQPPYHRKDHHNGILLVSAMTAAGDWHGLVIEPDGTLQPLNAMMHDDSYAIAEQVTVGDEVEIDYKNADYLSITGGSRDIDVLQRAAVAP